MAILPLSILLPIHNGMRFLPDIEMALTKNCEQYDEILIISNGSNDGSNEYILKWQKRDSRVQAICTTKKGLVQSLNLGIQKAQHDWIARFDIDDMYSNNRLNQQRQYLNTEVAAIFSDYEFQSFHGRYLGVVPAAIYNEATKLSLISGNRTAHPSVIFSKERALQVGGYNEKDFPAEDLSLWMRMSSEGTLITIPEILLKYRITRNSITMSQRNDSISSRKILVEQFATKLRFESLLEDFENIDSLYKHQSHGNLRTILHLRELATLGKIQGVNNQNLRRLRHHFIRFLAKPKSQRVLTCAISQKIVRDIYRLI